MSTSDVDRFMAELEHPMKASIERLRVAIMAENPTLTEQIKWKAPSFCVDGVDRVTFTLHPANHIRLVLHRGAKVREDVADFTFVDDTGLVAWATPDRGVVTFTSAEVAQQNEAALLGLIGRWVRV